MFRIIGIYVVLCLVIGVAGTWDSRRSWTTLEKVTVGHIAMEEVALHAWAALVDEWSAMNANETEN